MPGIISPIVNKTVDLEVAYNIDQNVQAIQMEVEELRSRVSTIKDNDVTLDAIELAVQNSNMLKLNEEAGTVGLAQEEKQWEVQK